MKQAWRLVPPSSVSRQACVLLCIMILAPLSGFAQPSRDEYRNAYNNWRQADPALETDAGAGGAGILQRADRAAAESAKYGAARAAYLNAWAEEIAQRALWLDNAAAGPPSPLESTKTLQDRVATETTSAGRSIDIYARDPDPGIQQLRQALERERAALAALGAAIAERQKAAVSAPDTTVAEERARSGALAAYRELIAGLRQTADETGRETAAWARYYQNLAEGAQALPPPDPAPTPPQLAPPKDDAPVPRAPKPSITPVSLLRYTGEWVFPSSNGLFHGGQPEFVTLVVHEDNGHATGTLSARFKVPAGSGVDPELRFDFAGDFKNVRTQTFGLETADGAKGAIDLIPGPAFNLLEVNFQTEMKPGKVRLGNFLLVKK
jgi:hypothetical protein